VIKVDHLLVWSDLEVDQFLMVRTDATFLAYDLELAIVGGLLYFTLAELEDRDGTIDNYSLPIPLGNLDLFLNGRSLIQDIDYVVNGSEIYIISKRHLPQPISTTLQHLHVRYTGFCRSDMSQDVIEDRGYIEHGVLSNNSRYDVRDDKVLRIIVNGRTYHRDALVYSELHDGVSILDPINGHPYQIKDIVVPMRGLTDTYSLRDVSIETDRHISDYMTIKLPQPERANVSAIVELYPVVSLFIARIIQDLVNDVILPETIEIILTDQIILSICSPYEYLLALDPISDVRRLDMDYVVIHPTLYTETVSISVHEYRFLVRVLALYGKNLVELNNFVTISNSGV